MWIQMQCGQHRDRGVHAWKTIGRGVIALHKGEEALRVAAVLFGRAPVKGRADREDNKEQRLQGEQQ